MKERCTTKMVRSEGKELEHVLVRHGDSVFGDWLGGLASWDLRTKCRKMRG